MHGRRVQILFLGLHRHVVSRFCTQEKVTRGLLLETLQKNNINCNARHHINLGETIKNFIDGIKIDLLYHVLVIIGVE